MREPRPRSKRAFPKIHGNARTAITWKQAEQIRRRRSPEHAVYGWCNSITQIAIDYEVAEKVIVAIVEGKTHRNPPRKKPKKRPPMPADHPLRKNHRKASKNHCAKLTDEQVRTIRRDTRSNEQAAHDRVGGARCPKRIGEIRARKRYASVPDIPMLGAPYYVMKPPGALAPRSLVDVLFRDQPYKIPSPPKPP